MKVTRRDVLSLCAASVFVQRRPTVAITMDDVRWQLIPAAVRADAEQRLLDHLGKHRIFLFAIGGAVDNVEGVRILNQWSAAGHGIGNHTYSHQPLFGRITPEAFETAR